MSPSASPTTARPNRWLVPADLPCPCHGSDKLCPDCAGSGVVTAAAIVDAGVRYFTDRARRNDTLAAMWGEW